MFQNTNIPEKINKYPTIKIKQPNIQYQSNNLYPISSHRLSLLHILSNTPTHPIVIRALQNHASTISASSNLQFHLIKVYSNLFPVQSLLSNSTPTILRVYQFLTSYQHVAS